MNASFKQINTLKLFTAFKMAYSCYFSFGGNLDCPEFLQKKFYNISYRVLSYKDFQHTFFCYAKFLSTLIG